MADPERGRQVLGELRRLGVRTSIDDYGTGYSSLAYLRHLPADELKLDRSLTADVDTRPAGRRPSSSTPSPWPTTSACAWSPRASRTPPPAPCSRDLGCDVAQGYAIARPMPVEDFLDWLAASATPPAGGRRSPPRPATDEPVQRRQALAGAGVAARGDGRQARRASTSAAARPPRLRLAVRHAPALRAPGSPARCRTRRRGVIVRRSSSSTPPRWWPVVVVRAGRPPRSRATASSGGVRPLTCALDDGRERRLRPRGRAPGDAPPRRSRTPGGWRPTCRCSSARRPCSDLRIRRLRPTTWLDGLDRRAGRHRRGVVYVIGPWLEVPGLRGLAAAVDARLPDRRASCILALVGSGRRRASGCARTAACVLAAIIARGQARRRPAADRRAGPWRRTSRAVRWTCCGSASPSSSPPRGVRPRPVRLRPRRDGDRLARGRRAAGCTGAALVVLGLERGTSGSASASCAPSGACSRRWPAPPLTVPELRALHDVRRQAVDRRPHRPDQPPRPGPRRRQTGRRPARSPSPGRPRRLQGRERRPRPRAGDELLRHARRPAPAGGPARTTSWPGSAATTFAVLVPARRGRRAPSAPAGCTSWPAGR